MMPKTASNTVFKNVPYAIGKRYSLEQLQQDKFEQGIEKGIEKGRVSERQETACKMLDDGLDTATVMKYTGLSSEELAALW